MSHLEAVCHLYTSVAGVPGSLVTDGRTVAGPLTTTSAG